MMESTTNKSMEEVLKSNIIDIMQRFPILNRDDAIKCVCTLKTIETAREEALATVLQIFYDLDNDNTERAVAAAGGETEIAIMEVSALMQGNFIKAFCKGIKCSEKVALEFQKRMTSRIEHKNYYNAKAAIKLWNEDEELRNRALAADGSPRSEDGPSTPPQPSSKHPSTAPRDIETFIAQFQAFTRTDLETARYYAERHAGEDDGMENALNAFYERQRSEDLDVRGFFKPKRSPPTAPVPSNDGPFSPTARAGLNSSEGWKYITADIKYLSKYYKNDDSAASVRDMIYRHFVAEIMMNFDMDEAEAKMYADATDDLQKIYKSVYGQESDPDNDIDFSRVLHAWKAKRDNWVHRLSCLKREAAKSTPIKEKGKGKLVVDEVETGGVVTGIGSSAIVGSVNNNPSPDAAEPNKTVDPVPTSATADAILSHASDQNESMGSAATFTTGNGDGPGNTTSGDTQTDAAEAPGLDSNGAQEDCMSDEGETRVKEQDESDSVSEKGIERELEGLDIGDQSEGDVSIMH